MPPDVHPARPEFQVLVTAAQAWPAFETAILEATHEISMGFRIFDLTTKLRSDRARGVGTD